MIRSGGCYGEKNIPIILAHVSLLFRGVYVFSMEDSKSLSFWDW
jgi:hypothetical protein